MFEVDHENFEAGRAAYARGASVLGLMEAVERKHAACESDHEHWQEHERDGKSLMLGFLDGVIGDIRKIAGSLRGGLRA